MTAPIIDLSTWSDPVIAERLRELLAMVERGEVLGLGLVVEMRDGVGTSYGRDPRGSVAKLVYGCALLQHRLVTIGEDEA